LKDVANEVSKDYTIRVGILKSKEPGMFCSGADLKVDKNRLNKNKIGFNKGKIKIF
jgi:enoyl-CoA hydratase/carnithine racemase